MLHRDTHELAWAAGFFDGEGCTNLGGHRDRNEKTACIQVCQSESTTLERFKTAVGGLGKIYGPYKRKLDTFRNTRPLWRWCAQRFEVTQMVIVLLWPYLSNPKKIQAKTMLAQFHDS